MPKYTDAFVIPVPKNKLADYLAMAGKSAQIWREYGALDYKECVLEDMGGQFGLPFPQGISTKDGETVVFSWIVYESRQHRDSVNQRVMADPRLKEMCGGDESNMPFDVKRMLFGGFEVRVDAFADTPQLATTA